MGTTAIRCGLVLGVLSALSTACTSSPQASSPPRVDAAADRATARAINLVVSDLPGWQQSPGSSGGTDPTSAKLATCAGAPDPATTQVADVSSPNFDQGATEVSSDVTMVRTHADGLADLRALTGPKIAGCVQQVLVPALQSQLPPSATASNVTVTARPAPVASPDSFGLRISLSISVPGQGAVSVVGDLLGVLVGRAEVGLTVFQSDGTAPDAALEARLFTLLRARARSSGA